MRRLGFALVCFLGTAAVRDPAWSQPVGQLLERHVRTSAGDAWDVWTAPARATPRDLGIAAGIVALAIAISPFDDDVDRWMVSHRHSAIDVVVERRDRD